MRLATLDNCFILINLCGYDIDRIPRMMPPRVLLEGFIGVCVCKKGESKSRISKASNLEEYVSAATKKKKKIEKYSRVESHRVERKTLCALV